MIHVVLVSLFALMLLFKSPLLAPFSLPQQSTSIALGFILIFAYLIGKKAGVLKLPQITGFILAGILCGPYVLKFLSTTEVEDLQLLDGLALSLIALTAGGEMSLERLKGRFPAITSIVSFQTVIIVLGFVGLGLAALPFLKILPENTLPHMLAFSLLLGTLATATSPSTTIAVITETRSQGRYTDLVLSAAVVKDFLIIGVFALVLSVSKLLLRTGEGFDSEFLVQILREVGGSLFLGGIIGAGITLYLKFVKREVTIFILAVAFFTYQISHNYGYHPLLICLLAGFLVQNFSRQGRQFIDALEKISMPIYVIFFAISGASLNLDALRSSWIIAAVCVLWRAGLKFAGTYIGARVSREDRYFQRKGWGGFISQAGVALGMVIVVADTFPEWGDLFQAFVLAIIAVNQIFGPILLQRFLVGSGEAGKKGSG